MVLAWGCLCRIPALGGLDHSRMLSVASSIAFSGMFQCGGAVLDAQKEWGRQRGISLSRWWTFGRHGGFRETWLWP